MSVVAERLRALRRASKTRMVAGAHKTRQLAARLTAVRHRNA